MVYTTNRKPFAVIERTINKTLDSGEEICLVSEEIIKTFEWYEQALNCMKKVETSELVMMSEETRKTRHAKGYTERLIYTLDTKKVLIRAMVDEWETFPQKGEK